MTKNKTQTLYVYGFCTCLIFEMEDKFVETVLSLYKENEWRAILHLNETSQNETARKLLWVWPSLENFKFMEAQVKTHNLSGIISVGCGCGLLEWIFQQYSKLKVIGYEVNKEWWTSRYCVPPFINLEYSPMCGLNNLLHPQYALLFCYFNDGSAFIQYVDSYSGSLIIIIGPGEGRGTHTDPEPFSPSFGNTKWKLLDYQEVKKTKDFIAVYTREN